MPRSRHQRGSVRLVGKRTQNWEGNYYVYDSADKRHHKAVILGTKAGMRKWEAEAKLQAIIDKETGSSHVKPSPVYTLKWFWENRYRPMKEPEWKPSSRPKTCFFFEQYLMSAFGDVPLGDLDRFQIQDHLNKLAQRYSFSVVSKFRVYIKAMLDEALEQDFISRNPARKLSLPVTRKPVRHALTVDEITALMAQLAGRDRLIVRMFLVLGLRPGELFSLRRNDLVTADQLRIDESVAEGGDCVTPKTAASAAYVWIPSHSLRLWLDDWMAGMPDKRPEAFLFPSTRGTPLNLHNFLRRTVQPAAKAAGLTCQVNHQAFRRTCATHMQAHGSVKDIQAHLRHTTPAMTVGVYMQQIPESVRAAVESLDRKLAGAVAGGSGA